MSAQRAQKTANNSVTILVALSHVTVILVTDLLQIVTVAMVSQSNSLTLEIIKIGCYDY